MSARGWLRGLLGWGSPSRNLEGARIADAIDDGMRDVLSTVPRERAEALEKLYDLADKLKKTEACAASRIEGQRCVTADVRWSGRELRRLLDVVTTREERRAVDRLRSDRAWTAVRESLAKGRP